MQGLILGLKLAVLDLLHSGLLAPPRQGGEVIGASRTDTETVDSLRAVIGSV